MLLRLGCTFPPKLFSPASFCFSPTCVGKQARLGADEAESEEALRPAQTLPRLWTGLAVDLELILALAEADIEEETIVRPAAGDGRTPADDMFSRLPRKFLRWTADEVECLTGSVKWRDLAN